MGYKKAKYVKWHNNYDDVLVLGNEYDVHGEKDEWLYIQDQKGSYQYYRKDCFEIVAAEGSGEFDKFQKAFKLACRTLGNHADCPALFFGETGWPECNGELDQCGDREQWECWQKYFLERIENVKCELCRWHVDCICVVCEEGNTVVCKLKSKHMKKDDTCERGELDEVHLDKVR